MNFLFNMFNENRIKALEAANLQLRTELGQLREEYDMIRTLITVRIDRVYSESGTNGKLYVDDVFIGYTIELPWKNNTVRESCIPEGEYTLTKRRSPKFKDHIHITNVPGRSLILFHPANNAATELLGCIAPVSELSGPGRGITSRPVFQKLLSIIYGAIDHGKAARLIIRAEESTK